MIKNILVIGDSNKSNRSDKAFNLYSKYGLNVTYLSPKRSTDFKGESHTLSPFYLDAKINKIVKNNNISLIYLRGDWFDNTILIYADKIISLTLNIPIVFGYHCHTAMLTATEKKIIENADGLILLNKQAEEHFKNCCNISNIPVLNVPSLFFPNKSFYNEFKDVSLIDDNYIHCVIPTGVIRLSSIPKKFDKNIHYENFLFERYDYYNVIKNLVMRGIKVHLYGDFHDHGENNMTEAVYKKLSHEFEGMIFFHGFYRGNNFVNEISKYHFTVMTGLVPNSIAPPFEHMNYQVRLNVILAARVPVFVAKGTYGYMEDLINKEKIGSVFDSFDHLSHLVKNSKKMKNYRSNIEKVLIKHSNEYWVPKIAQFLKQIKLLDNKKKLKENGNVYLKYTLGYLKKVKIITKRKFIGKFKS